MQTTNTFLEERRNLQALYSRKTIDTQWTQQLIQPLQTAYGPGNEVRLVLQRSKHMVDLGKGIGLSFRPVIQFNADGMPDIARKSFMCCTPVLASDFFNLAQVTTNGNAICAQSNISLSKPRNLFQNYYNSLISKKKYRIDGEDAFFSGTMFPGTYGDGKVGFEENAITHPWANYTQNPAGLQPSKYEADPYPRAIISKVWTYNQEFSLQPLNSGLQTTAQVATSNVYYTGWITGSGRVGYGESGSLGTGVNFGGIPITAANNGDIIDYNVNFPLIGLMVTASVAEYKKFNERAQKMRMRFISATTSIYNYSGGLTGLLINSPIQTSTTVPSGQNMDSAGAAFVLQPTVNNAGGSNTNSTLAAPNIVVYGTSVQGPMGTGACVPSQSNINRYGGLAWSGSSSTYFPQENYTNLMVHLNEVSIELDQIGTICCDSTQTIIQLQCSEPKQVLSSYLQPSYFGLYGTQKNMLPTTTPGYAGPTSQNCQTFLQNCLIGSATYFITDLVCRVEYQSYPDEAYPIVRELLYQPIPYQSIRSQADIITSVNGQFTQRLSIGGSALLNAVVVFIIPNFPVPLVPQSSTIACRPQDCLVDYMGFNIPSCGDARAVPTLDSVYIPWTQFSVQVDNKIYEANPIIPVNNASYASYLKAQEGSYAVWGKYLPQDLRSFLTNRFCYVLPINPKNNREDMIVDQQVIISISFDASARKAQAQTMGTYNQTGDGRFWLQSFAVVSQSLVNCDYVKI